MTTHTNQISCDTQDPKKKESTEDQKVVSKESDAEHVNKASNEKNDIVAEDTPTVEKDAPGKEGKIHDTEGRKWHEEVVTATEEDNVEVYLKVEGLHKRLCQFHKEHKKVAIMKKHDTEVKKVCEDCNSNEDIKEKRISALKKKLKHELNNLSKYNCSFSEVEEKTTKTLLQIVGEDDTGLTEEVEPLKLSGKSSKPINGGAMIKTRGRECAKHTMIEMGSEEEHQKGMNMSTEMHQTLTEEEGKRTLTMFGPRKSASAQKMKAFLANRGFKVECVMKKDRDCHTVMRDSKSNRVNLKERLEVKEVFFVVFQGSEEADVLRGKPGKPLKHGYMNWGGGGESGFETPYCMLTMEQVKELAETSRTANMTRSKDWHAPSKFLGQMSKGKDSKRILNYFEQCEWMIKVRCGHKWTWELPQQKREEDDDVIILDEGHDVQKAHNDWGRKRKVPTTPDWANMCRAPQVKMMGIAKSESSDGPQAKKRRYEKCPVWPGSKTMATPNAWKPRSRSMKQPERGSLKKTVEEKEDEAENNHKQVAVREEGKLKAIDLQSGMKEHNSMMASLVLLQNKQTDNMKQLVDNNSALVKHVAGDKNKSNDMTHGKGECEHKCHDVIMKVMTHLAHANRSDAENERAKKEGRMKWARDEMWKGRMWKVKHEKFDSTKGCPGEGPQQATVVSFNASKMNGFKWDWLMANYRGGELPDVVAIQESATVVEKWEKPNELKMKLKIDDHKCTIVKNMTGKAQHGSGMMIACKTKPRWPDSCKPLRKSQLEGEQVQMIKTKLVGLDVVVLNMYQSPNPKKGETKTIEKTVKLIMQLKKKGCENIILMTDTNARHSMIDKSMKHGHSNKRGKALMQLIESAGMKIMSNTDMPTNADKTVIDFILMSDEMANKNMRIKHIMSDCFRTKNCTQHAPVAVKIIRDTEPEIKKKRTKIQCWNEVNENEYDEKFNTAFKGWGSEITRNMLNENALLTNEEERARRINDMHESFHEKWEETRKKIVREKWIIERTNKNKGSEGWDNICEELKAEKRMKTKTWKKSAPNMKKHAMKEMRRVSNELRRRRNKLQTEEELKKHKEAANMNGKQRRNFFKLIKEHKKGDGKVEDLRKKDGEMAKTNIQKAIILNERHGKVANELTDRGTEDNKQLVPRSEQFRPNVTDKHEKQNRWGKAKREHKAVPKMTGCEVWRGMKLRMRARKAPGADGTKTKEVMLLKKGNSAFEAMATLFTWSLVLTGTSEEWKKSMFKPKKKPNRDVNEAASYRPICLTSVLLKLMETMMDERVRRKICEQSPDKFRGNAGWQRGRRMDEQVVRVMAAANLAKRMGLEFGMMSVDLKNCFDVLKLKIMQEKLIGAGLTRGGKLEQWIMNAMAKRKYATEVEGERTEHEEHTWGVPQGSVLSPIVCAVHLNDMIEEETEDGVNKKGMQGASYDFLKPGLNAAQFADDVIIWAAHKNLDEVKKILKSGVNKCNEWCKCNGMQFSMEKCESMFLNCEGKQGKNYDMWVEREGENIKMKVSNKNFVEKKNPKHKRGNKEPENIVEPGTMRYLGFHFDQKFANLQNMQKVATKATRKTRLMSVFNRRGRKTIPELRKLILQSVVRGQMELHSKYIGWGSAEAEKALHKADARATKKMLEMELGSAREDAYAISGELNIKERGRVAMMRMFIDHEASEAPNKLSDAIMANRKSNATKGTNLIAEQLAEMEYMGLGKAKVKQTCEFDAADGREEYMNMEREWPTLPKYKGEDATDENKKAAKKWGEDKMKECLSKQDTIMFTDGSCDPTSRLMGGAVIIQKRGEEEKKLPIPKWGEVGSALGGEATALWCAIRMVRKEEMGKVTTFSDCQALLKAVGGIRKAGTRWVQQTRNELWALNKEKKGTLNIKWIPSHVGIEGNTKADLLAKEALKRSTMVDGLGYTWAEGAVLKAILKENMQLRKEAHWEEDGANSRGEPRFLQRNIMTERRKPKCPFIRGSFAATRTMNKLRSGHCQWAGHRNIAKKKGEDEITWMMRECEEMEGKICTMCDQGRYKTIEHVFLECEHEGICKNRKIMQKEMKETIVFQGGEQLGDYLSENWQSAFREDKKANRRETEQALWAVVRFVCASREWTGDI